MKHAPRILLAKIGLDGHDRGVKVLARAFRDAGLEVIYTGLWQTCQATMHAALQEDVDVVGVSLLSAAHLTVMPELIRIRKELGIEQIPVVLGGIVPEGDHAVMKQIGVAAVFNPGSSMDAIIAALRSLAAERRRAPLESVRAGYGAGDVRALARLLTAIQRGENPDGWSPPPGQATVIGVTGAPGVGKSSFIAKLSAALRQRGMKVAVVAVDPTSPVTGGALLGDRLRMMGDPADGQFFVRSMSSGDVHDGLGPHTRDVVAALSGFGFDVVLVETVGAGQGDVGVRHVAHKTLLILMPESGDAIQFSKAGIIEIADAFVINKCDLPGADATQAQLTGAVGDGRPVWQSSTMNGAGISSVAEWVAALRKG